MRQLIGVAAGNSIKEKHFQDLMTFKSAQTLRKKTLSNTGAMAVMEPFGCRHLTFLPFIGLMFFGFFGTQRRAYIQHNPAAIPGCFPQAAERENIGIRPHQNHAH